MFCCKCGAEIHHQAIQCHKCGDLLPGVIAPRSAGPTQAIHEDPKCHKCGAADGLKSWDFGLGKIVDSKRAWGATAISAAVSAVTLTSIGFGLIRMPGRTNSFHVVRLRLVLCDTCWQNHAGYSAHPFWDEAHQLGFIQFFDPREITDLKPIR